MNIEKVVVPYAWELYQARIDEAIVTGRPLVERPVFYRNITTRQEYYDIFGCIGWPTEVSEKDEGRPGYVGVVGVVKNVRKPEDAAFQLLGEAEDKNITTLLEHGEHLREEWGFGLHPNLLTEWYGDPRFFNTQMAVWNERKVLNSRPKEIFLIIPPVDLYEQHTFEHYTRSLHSTMIANKVRFYFGHNIILKNRIKEFKRDDPAVFAMGGLVHTLLLSTIWMDAPGDNAFTTNE